MEDTIFEQRLDLSELNGAVQRLQDEIGKVIVGQDELVQLIIIAILADGHVLIEGVPGVAKTLAAKLVAKSMQVGFSRVQFTPDLMPSDVLGTNIFNPGSGRFEFRKGPVFGHVVLIDEINRAPAKTQAALFEVMEERQVTMDGITHKMQHPFMVLATQNPIEQEGTYRLPEAQLDRFLFKIKVPYPSEAQEIAILQRFQQTDAEEGVLSVTPVVSGDDIMRLRAVTRQVIAEEKLLTFIARIIVATRNDKSVYLGASPRASLALLNAAKAAAAVAGRDFITPDDVIFVARPVLRHRLILTPEREMEGVTEDEVIHNIVHSIEIPR